MMHSGFPWLPPPKVSGSEYSESRVYGRSTLRSQRPAMFHRMTSRWSFDKWFQAKKAPFDYGLGDGQGCIAETFPFSATHQRSVSVGFGALREALHRQCPWGHGPSSWTRDSVGSGTTGMGRESHMKD